jgi:hypothetical protein
MSTFDLSFGNKAGLQEQGPQMSGINYYEVDFAEALALNPTMTGADILTAGTLPAGALIKYLAIEALTAAQSGAADIKVQDGTGTPVVYVTALSIATPVAYGAGGSVASPNFFGGGDTVGLHPVFLTADRKINILLGATAPTKGKVRISVDLSLMTGLG